MKHIIHRDQIHKDVYFDPLSIELINTPQLQRLGRIYQLGFAHLVFRGGTHTRLSHVMGVAHVADALVTALKRNYELGKAENSLPKGATEPDLFLPIPKKKKSVVVTEDERWDALAHLVRWAALLHDLGHIPIGHTIEDEFSGIYLKHDSFKSVRMPYLWDNLAGQASPIKRVLLSQELYPASIKKMELPPTDVWRAVMLICLYKELSGDSEEREKNDFTDLYFQAVKDLQGNLFHRYMADIVADTICADYIDYLRRDTINVGLDTVEDIRIIQSYYIGEDPKKGYKSNTKNYRMALSLNDKGGKQRLSICTSAKNIVRHRFDLAEIIYYHKTKVAASAMLAKVFSLIEKPNEISTTPRLRVGLTDVSKLLDNINKDPKIATHYKKDYLPDSLLDSSIGDETLLFWLQQKAWDVIVDGAQQAEKAKVKRGLMAVSFLEGIIERRLYKVAISLDAEFIGKFARTSHAKARENKIENILEKYRTGDDAPQKRDDIEQLMAHSTKMPSLQIVGEKSFLKHNYNIDEFPENSFLLYIPSRKAQAKGIETGAFDDNGEVITLGDHNAVIDDLKTLNEEYKKLWKILIYVHPDFRNENIELSEAVDGMLAELFPKIDCSELSNEIKKACWFPYISPENRKAAVRYRRIKSLSNSQPNWTNFALSIKTSDSTTGPEEHAFRTLLLDGLYENVELKVVKSLYKNSTSLEDEVNKEIATFKAVESGSGTPDIDNILKAIENINKRISEGKLFGDDKK